MIISTEFGLVLAVQLLTIGIFVGTLKASMKFFELKLKALEEKQDRHNGWVERIIVNEQRGKAAHKRLDEHLKNHQK
jgi:hypothetical protein